MVDIPVLVVGANKLNSRPRRNQETVRRLGDITSMMKPVRIHIWSELFLDLAGLGVAPRIHARVLTRGRRSNPDQPIHYQQVLRGLVTRVGMVRVPQCVAILFGDADHFAVAPRIEHDFIVDDQSRTEIKSELIATTDRLGFPSDFAGSMFDTDQLLTIVEVDPRVIGRQGQGRNFGLFGPKGFS